MFSINLNIDQSKKADAANKNIAQQEVAGSQ